MNIFLFSSVYPSQNAPKGTTPVVHYFAKEWVKLGHKIHVFHTATAFPKVYYLFGKLFKKNLDSLFGHLVPTSRPVEYEEIKDGVVVTHLVLKKCKPHGRFSKTQVQNAFSIISECIRSEGSPDCFVGHWDNPQLELLHLLKESFHRPTCIVYHSNQFAQLFGLYGKETISLVNDIDLVGFRNTTAQADYERHFGKPSHSFIAASGVSRPFLEAGLCYAKDIRKVERFAYVGALISRKYPTIIISALSQSFPNEPFEITYVGEGDARQQIVHLFEKNKCQGKLVFTGRIPRDKVIQYLKWADVFVMVSKRELFGLVYLEAMALGCITIAARNEGIDGIIEDGVDGFLCEAGNTEELASIITRIREMSPEALMDISQKAQKKANDYSDVKVAERYIEALKVIVNYENCS